MARARTSDGHSQVARWRRHPVPLDGAGSSQGPRQDRVQCALAMVHGCAVRPWLPKA